MTSWPDDKMKEIEFKNVFIVKLLNLNYYKPIQAKKQYKLGKSKPLVFEMWKKREAKEIPIYC